MTLPWEIPPTDKTGEDVVKNLYKITINEEFISVRQVQNSSTDGYTIRSDIEPVYTKALEDNSQHTSHNFLTNICQVYHLQYLVSFGGFQDLFSIYQVKKLSLND